MSITQFFPFIPDYMSWDDWNGNLVMFFQEEPIPINDEMAWKNTAASLSALPTFQSYPIPDADLFDSWQEWADALAVSLNGPTQ